MFDFYGMEQSVWPGKQIKTMKKQKMTKVSDRLNRLSESATLAMARMSRELKGLGKDVIALSLGEPDFNTPEFIKDAAKEAINNNFSHYTPVAGLDELRISISEGRPSLLKKPPGIFPAA